MYSTDASAGNRLIAGLAADERRKILAHCELVNLSSGDVLCAPHEPLQHAYLPVSGFISLVRELRGHQPLGMALVGNEGMLGATLVLGIADAPLHAVVQGTGTAWRMSAPQMRHQLSGSSSLTHALQRYLYVSIVQLAQTATCIHFHDIEPRLARWLLLSHDRAYADHFHLTHEFLAGMLGVRRSSITIAASTLQQRGLIHYTRGNIHVSNRAGLESAACECYANSLHEYEAAFNGHQTASA